MFSQKNVELNHRIPMTTNPPKAKHTFDIGMLQVDYCKRKSKFKTVMEYNS